ncbi:MAG TPA: ribulose-phosphate 3-epimerase, partial [bacterium]|nr:ribulose-phosphate 3-epimerase [bacterium]
MTKIAPSILSADFMNLEKELRKLEKADMIHLDIMDGSFVPNLTFGPDIVSRISAKTSLPLSAHLMTVKPGEKWRWFRDAGCRSILFHIETAAQPLPLIGKIRRAGLEAGLVLNPETDPRTLEPYIGTVDSILVMSVRPGFGGQKFI